MCYILFTHLDCVDMVHKYYAYFQLTSLYSYLVKTNDDNEIKSRIYVVKSLKNILNLSNGHLEKR